MEQTWHDLLFLHWPLPPEQVRAVVPQQLELDLFDGQAWVAVVPFGIRALRARWLPQIPGTATFPELNVRTYVVHHGKPGVYFFSLDAANLLAVWGARTLYRLPYFFAKMNLRKSGNHITYSCNRFYDPRPAIFQGGYRSTTPARIRAPGTLESWLTERYCLFTVARNTVYRGDIHHLSWPLQDAETEIQWNSMAAASRIQLPSHAPLAHYVAELQVLFWPLQKAS